MVRIAEPGYGFALLGKNEAILMVPIVIHQY